MKIKLILSGFAALMLFFSFANAQPTMGGDPQTCQACAPSLSPIQVQTTPNQCFLRFTTNTGMNGNCEVVSYEWTSSDQSAKISEKGGDAVIQFSADGDITVCCILTVGADRDGNGTIDADEQCQVAQCVIVSVPDECDWR